MFFEKNNSEKNGLKVLVAPLDWGLGHATRCIPIIYSLLNNGATVFVAAEGAVKKLLEKELPQVIFLPLPGYNVHYTRKKWLLPFSLLLQLPKIIRAVYKEHYWLKEAVAAHCFTAVISDNRLGLFNRHITSVYITHQLTIKTGNRFTEWLLQKVHYFFINRYHHCWVPDNEKDFSLAGNLSHPKKKPAVPVTYLGPLTRFKKKDTAKIFDVLILLSGPEPQRTLFENLLLKQLETYTGKAVLVRGLPLATTAPTSNNTNLTVHNHLTAHALNTIILQSHAVICRSGYTTVMDLMALQQKAVMVPTPGQTEQEYLSNYLAEKKYCLCAAQHNFLLPHILNNVASFSFSFPPDADACNYKTVIENFIKSLY